MNYLIVCPVRCGSSWLNHVLETHYKLYNVGERLCKIAPGIMEEGMQKDLIGCLLYTSPSPRDGCRSRMPSSA